MQINYQNPLFRALRYLHALAGSALVLLALFMLVNATLFTTFRVDGHSMEPALHNGQLLGISLVSYVLAPPRVGDIVIVRYAGDASIHFVKRIEGVPGDRVSWDGRSQALSDDQYFVEGDNRDHSTDSRTYGPIKRDQIVGKVVVLDMGHLF